MLAQNFQTFRRKDMQHESTEKRDSQQDQSHTPDRSEGVSGRPVADRRDASFSFTSSQGVTIA